MDTEDDDSEELHSQLRHSEMDPPHTVIWFQAFERRCEYNVELLQVVGLNERAKVPDGIDLNV